MKKNPFNIACQVLLIISILLFSCKGKVNENEARGTVGKVNKYRKTQMTENDIKLRSQLTEDTAQLANTIKGLLIFDAYTRALSHDLDNHLPALDVCECDQNDALKLEVLRNFNDYIKNNDSLIVKTIAMLSDFYKDTVTAQSYDVERDMKNIVNYFNQLDKRDTIMDHIIDNIDAYLKANPAKKGEEIEKIKNIRDGIVLRDVQMAMMVGNQTEIQSVAERSILNLDNLYSMYGGQANLSRVISAQQINAVCSTGHLSEIISSQAGVGFIVMDQDVIRAVNSYASQGVIGSYILPGAVVSSMHNIGSVYSSQSGLQDLMSAVGGLIGSVSSLSNVLNVEPL